MLETLTTFDQLLFSIINQELTHPWLDYLLPLWRTKTTWIPLYILLLLVIGKRYGSKIFFILLIIALTILLSDQISSQWIKKAVQRLRPCRDDELQGVRILIHCGGGYSFTSSHATNHFALVMQLFLLFRNQWSKFYFVLLFIWAAIIGYAQIYVGVHYPIDVLSGSFLGCMIALALAFLVSYIPPLKQCYER